MAVLFTEEQMEKISRLDDDSAKFLAALLELETKNTSPLAEYLRSDSPLDKADREILANIIEALAKEKFSFYFEGS